MRVGRRRVAALATVLVVLGAGTGVARAYFAPGAAQVSSPEGYFSFCADRQRDTAGITPADLTTANYGIDNYVYDTPGPLVGQDLINLVKFERSPIIRVVDTNDKPP